ncbi:fatty acyl-CoA reductase wat-like [Athalia rosae]|uniref:fatty acyl-CoA reductase wat-like n=1 Tax=Athalia rosae TaxID=37344 RepID=UPI002033D63F|nr:fatty acyl-CoA reductase wat-like [Athalia rosae]
MKFISPCRVMDHVDLQSRKFAAAEGEMSEIQQFYAGKNVFITGATGFIGKVLTEKLVRSCRDIGRIYVLIREKKGKTPEDRKRDLLSNEVFDVVRREYPEFADKITAVAGDATISDFGLSSRDRNRIVNEVSVIFHAAANVRFDESLPKAVVINVNSVKYMMDIAKDCVNLKAAIHVSTAYSNCVQEKIDEVIYAPPISYNDINAIVNVFENSNWTEKTKDEITKRVIGKWPNTYTFTKAVGEGVVLENAKDLPVAIFRPSIVLATAKEPVPGWLSSAIGFSGALVGIGVGVISVMKVDVDKKCDCVPADMVCNSLIACAWETANAKRRPAADIPVYNYVSGPENPLLWEEFNGIGKPIAYSIPTSKSVYYNSCFYVKNTIVFLILEFFLHALPALTLDAIRRPFGIKPRFYKIFLKGSKLMSVVSYFTLNDWDFRNHRTQNLWDRLKPEDKEIFPFSMRELNWPIYIKDYCYGIRRYLARDGDETIPQARRRQTVLYIIHCIVRLFLAALVLLVLWKLIG